MASGSNHLQEAFLTDQTLHHRFQAVLCHSNEPLTSNLGLSWSSGIVAKSLETLSPRNKPWRRANNFWLLDLTLLNINGTCP